MKSWKNYGKPLNGEIPEGSIVIIKPDFHEISRVPIQDRLTVTGFGGNQMSQNGTVLATLPKVTVMTGRKELRRFWMKTALKIVGLVLLGLYFSACSTFPDITGQNSDYEKNLAKTRGNHFISDQPYYEKIKAQGLLEPEFINAPPVDDVIEVYIIGVRK